jgi:hypothetical protein
VNVDGKRGVAFGRPLALGGGLGTSVVIDELPASDSAS